MIGWFFKVLTWITSLWGGLSDKDKEKIIDTIVSLFTALFKAFYHTSKEEDKSSKKESNA